MSYLHLEHLKRLIPNLLDGQLLDVGSGKGKLLLAVAEEHGSIIGLECNPAYISEAQKKLTDHGLHVEMIEGKAEALPFDSDSFDFINMSELIEHVQDPEAVLRQAFKVLRPGGLIYVSVPNRFGAFDPHFHLWGLNWLPRVWVSSVLTILGKHKDYSTEAGHQKLTEMHYCTFAQFDRLACKVGFQSEDIRLRRLKGLFQNRLAYFLLRLAYIPFRALYFNTFHFLLIKPTLNES